MMNNLKQNNSDNEGNPSFHMRSRYANDSFSEGGFFLLHSK